jgi:phosphinothricin acetyltransferase
MRIRDASPLDGPTLCAIYAPYITDSATSFELAVPSPEEMAQRVAKAQQHWAWLVAVDEHDEVLGYAYATELRSRPAYRYSCETSVYVSPQAQGKGVAKALYQALFERLANRNLCNAFAAIVLPNPPSVRLHESQGFQPVGTLPRAGFKHGTWHSIGWWYRPLRDWPEEMPATSDDGFRG